MPGRPGSEAGIPEFLSRSGRPGSGRLSCTSPNSVSSALLDAIAVSVVLQLAAATVPFLPPLLRAAPVVDLANDPGELENLGHPDHPGHDPSLVQRMLDKLHVLVQQELGDDCVPFDLDLFGT